MIKSVAEALAQGYSIYFYEKRNSTRRHHVIIIFSVSGIYEAACLNLLCSVLLPLSTDRRAFLLLSVLFIQYTRKNAVLACLLQVACRIFVRPTSYFDQEFDIPTTGRQVVP
jgi:hypothetical protein